MDHRSPTHAYPPTTTATQTSKDMQRARREPSIFLSCMLVICSILMTTSGVLFVLHVVFVEYVAFYIVSSSVQLFGGGMALIMGLWEYRKVVDARNQQDAEAHLANEHCYP